jgi:twitching motility two-component system response regulator PilG
MQDSRTVAVVGFNATELLVLGSIFGLAAKRIPRFVRHSDPATLPDLFLADADDASALAELLRRNADGRVPVVLVGMSDHGTGWPVLPRPLQWASVIVAFDHAIRSTAPVASPAPEPVVPPRSKRSAPDTILIVGSDPGFNALVFERLSQYAVTIEEAPDIDAALERFASRHFPCVIIDGDSRDVESLRLCKAIKSRKGRQPTAVIIASGVTEHFDRVRATMAGCDAFLAKPLSDRKLDDAIQRYVAAAAAY